MLASPLLIQGKSRMRKRACTDLCGGRSAMVVPTATVIGSFLFARDPPETGSDCSDRRLHCEDGAEPGLALGNAVVSPGCLSQWVRLHNRFNSSLRYEIKRFVKIFGAVLLATNYSNALRDEIHQRNRKRLRIGAHGDEPAVRSQSTVCAPGV